MKTFELLLLVLPLLAFGGCQSAPPADSTSRDAMLQEEHPIDGLSRNVTETNGGAIRDNYNLAPPPVRRDYATER